MTRKMLTTALIALVALATVAAAQAPPRPPGQGPGAGGGQSGANPPQGQQQPQGPPPEVVLREVLGFTEAQLADLHELMDARRLAVEALQPQIAAAEQALQEALRAEHPDGCDVGSKMLALNGLRGKIGDADRSFKEGLAALLTAEQKAKVDSAYALQRSLQAAEVFHRLGL